MNNYYLLSIVNGNTIYKDCLEYSLKYIRCPGVRAQMIRVLDFSDQVSSL